MMQLISYFGPSGPGFGRIDGQTVVPMGGDIIEFLRKGTSEEDAPIGLDGVTMRAPVPLPGKIICVGLNYRDHAIESAQPIPEEPILFTKFANSVIGPGEEIRLPSVAPDRVDYEAELCAVIGREAREVAPLDALSFVGGYTCANDVSARDLQLSVSQWTRGKAVDTFLPLGPRMVTPDEVSDPQQLAIRCLINGTVVQDSNTAEMIFSVADLIAYISATITLSPGDLIVTGTPPGVGFMREPALYLREGDEVTVEIERIGRLTNTVALGR